MIPGIAAKLTAALPGAVLAVLARVLTRGFYEQVAALVLVRVLERIAASTSNTLDDEVVKEVRRRLDMDGGET